MAPEKSKWVSSFVHEYPTKDKEGKDVLTKVCKICVHTSYQEAHARRQRDTDENAQPEENANVINIVELEKCICEHKKKFAGTYNNTTTAKNHIMTHFTFAANLDDAAKYKSKDVQDKITALSTSGLFAAEETKTILAQMRRAAARQSDDKNTITAERLFILGEACTVASFSRVECVCVQADLQFREKPIAISSRQVMQQRMEKTQAEMEAEYFARVGGAFGCLSVDTSTKFGREFFAVVLHVMEPPSDVVVQPPSAILLAMTPVHELLPEVDDDEVPDSTEQIEIKTARNQAVYLQKQIDFLSEKGVTVLSIASDRARSLLAACESLGIFSVRCACHGFFHLAQHVAASSPEITSTLTFAKQWLDGNDVQAWLVNNTIPQVTAVRDQRWLDTLRWLKDIESLRAREGCPGGWTVHQSNRLSSSIAYLGSINEAVLICEGDDSNQMSILRGLSRLAMTVVTDANNITNVTYQNLPQCSYDAATQQVLSAIVTPALLITAFFAPLPLNRRLIVNHKNHKRLFDTIKSWMSAPAMKKLAAFRKISFLQLPVEMATFSASGGIHWEGRLTCKSFFAEYLPAFKSMLPNLGAAVETIALFLASEASAERAFWLLRNVLTEDRRGLSDINVEMCTKLASLARDFVKTKLSDKFPNLINNATKEERKKEEQRKRADETRDDPDALANACEALVYLVLNTKMQVLEDEEAEVKTAGLAFIKQRKCKAPGCGQLICPAAKAREPGWEQTVGGIYCPKCKGQVHPACVGRTDASGGPLVGLHIETCRMCATKAKQLWW